MKKINDRTYLQWKQAQSLNDMTTDLHDLAWKVVHNILSKTTYAFHP